MMKKIIVTALVILGFTPAALSQFTLQQPTYGGSACLSGTASIAFLDGSISIFFDSHVFPVASKQIKKNCVVRFPVLVSNGFQVRQELIHARGFAGISAGKAGQVDLKLLVTGSHQSTPAIMQKFGGPIWQEFNLKGGLITDGKIAWSPCGQSQIFVTSEITSTITRQNGLTMVETVAEDNFLYLEELRLEIQARRCK